MSGLGGWTAESVQEAIGPHLSNPALMAALAAAAPALAGVLNHEIAGAAAAAQLQGAQPVLDDLKAQRARVEHGGAVLDFGAAIIGTATVGDVAGGDIVKIVVNLAGQPYPILEQTPYHDMEHSIVTKLRDVDPAVLDRAARKLGFDPQVSGIAPVWGVARGLIRADFKTLTEVVDEIALSTCDGILDLIELVAPFCWVKPEAAALIPPVLTHPAGLRAIGVNANEVRTGMSYVSCAPLSFRAYILLSIDSSWAEPVADRVRDTIIAQLAQMQWCMDEANCVAELAEAGTSVVVVVPPPVPPAAVLAELRAIFPTITFVLLAGSGTSQATFKGYGLPGVDFLTPELEIDAEAQAKTLAFNAKRVARLSARTTDELHEAFRPGQGTPRDRQAGGDPTRRPA